MSPAPATLASLAPPLPPPAAPRLPELPAAPAGLGDGSVALGALPEAPWTVRQLPRRFLMAGVVPLGIAAALTLLSLPMNWPGTPEAALKQAMRDLERMGRQGKPAWYQAPGVTPPEPVTQWPVLRSVVGFPGHTADVVVRFVVNTDGTVDRTGLTVQGRGAGPITGLTAVTYSKMRFRPGRVGSQVVPVVMERRFHFPQ